MESDLERAAEELAAHRHRLRRSDAGRLSGILRSRIHAREQVEYLTRGLAEGTISATSGCELLTAYLEAGYVDEEQFQVLRRSVFEAHRRELMALLSDDTSDAPEYFRQLDAYRAAGYLSEQELAELEQLLDAKLNPAKAASRLFAKARVSLDVEEQEALLLRYLMEYEGFADYGAAASEYLALKIDQVWEVLPTVRYARSAVVLIHELNSLLVAYLPYTNDIGESVPSDQIVGDFLALANGFEAEPDVDGPITVNHLRQKAIVTSQRPAEKGTYEAERNRLIGEGAEGRVVAVRPMKVTMSLVGRSLGYTKIWRIREFDGSQYSHIHPGSSLSCWDQAEVALKPDARPSPVFVHQYREAVKRMSRLLSKHREDRSPKVDREGTPARS